MTVSRESVVSCDKPIEIAYQVRAKLGEFTADAGIKNTIFVQLSDLIVDDLYRPDLGERIMEIASSSRMGPKSALRFLSHQRRLLEDPTFDDDLYYRLFVFACQRFGRNSAGFFSRGYGYITRQGIPPERYFKFVDDAVEVNGRKFGGLYACGLVDVLKTYDRQDLSKEDIVLRFRSEAGEIRRTAGIDAAASFLLQVGRVKTEMSLSFEWLNGYAMHSIHTLGKQAVRWMIDSLVDLNNLGYDPKRFFEDAKRMHHKAKSAKQREKVASWFAHGFKGALEIDRRIKETETTQRFSEQVVNNYKKVFGRDFDTHPGIVWQRKRKAFNPLNYVKTYEGLFDALGQEAAVFYARILNIGKVEDREPTVFYLLNIPYILKEFKERVSQKTFEEALFYVPRCIGDYRMLTDLIEDVAKTYEECGEKVTIDRLIHTNVICRRGSLAKRLVTSEPLKRRYSKEEMERFYMENEELSEAEMDTELPEDLGEVYFLEFPEIVGNRVEYPAGGKETVLFENE